MIDQVIRVNGHSTIIQYVHTMYIVHVVVSTLWLITTVHLHVSISTARTSCRTTLITLPAGRGGKNI